MHLKIDDEPIDLFWDGLLRDLKEAAAGQGIREFPHELVRRTILNVLTHRSEDIVELITVPADGTGKPVLKYRISARFKRHVTEAALDILGVNHSVLLQH